MEDSMKCWSILESLNFPTIGAPAEGKLCNLERVRSNVNKIQKAIPLTPVQVTDYLIESLNLSNFTCEATNIKDNKEDQYSYTIYLLYVLRAICKDTDFVSASKENLVVQRHRLLAIATIEDVVEFGLKLNLHPSFYKEKGSIFYCDSYKKCNFYRTALIVAAFSPFVYIQFLYVSQMIQKVTICYMAAIQSLIFASEEKEHDSQVHLLRTDLSRIWLKLSKRTYFKNLMIFYAILPNEYKKKIHEDMVLKLWSSGGFLSLLFALLESKQNEGKSISQIVCNLVAKPSYPDRAQLSLTKQILQFIEACPSNTELMPHMGVGLLALKELCNIKAANKDVVRSWLRQQFKALLEIDETRITVMEWVALKELINLLFHMFCTSSIESLQSELLLPYLPLLIMCHMQIRNCGKQDHVCSHISSLILNILNNRKRDEIESIVKFIAQNTYPENWLFLHHEIVFEDNPLCATELRIVQKGDVRNVFHSSSLFALVVILKESSFSLISFQVFMTLFRLVPTLGHVTNDRCVSSNVKMLLSDEEMEDNAIKEQLLRYELQLDIVKSLELLLQQKTLRALMIENIGEIQKALQEMLIAFSLEVDQSGTKVDGHVLFTLLALIGELVEECKSSNLKDVRKVLMAPLNRLKMKVEDENLKFKINHLQKLLQDDQSHLKESDTSAVKFIEARSLIQANESYKQVQGIEELIRLINAKETYALSNVHVITTLALNTLNCPESYTFLNCVRLFASLVHVNGPAVLDLLIDEYTNESADKDYRLVVGEALLKVCKQLGPLCYSYRGILINCYMTGCRSPLDEFRFSSFSNLAQICRILSYQVQNFFQELLHLIDCELTTEKYLPAKRAAVMVLSDLLEGMDNLKDYEEMLLPIYRLLKFLAYSENTDDKIRLHASKGLETLSEKCKQLLTAAFTPPLEKEIDIIGTGNKHKSGDLKKHILYMN